LSVRETDSFVLIPNLPVEARLQIWRQALQESDLKVIEFYYHHDEDPVEAMMDPSFNPMKESCQRKFLPPTLPRVCREARNEILRAYQPIANCKIQDIDLWNEGGQKVPVTAFTQQGIVTMCSDFKAHHPHWEEPVAVLKLCKSLSFGSWEVRA
jgi:hypothetical protein